MSSHDETRNDDELVASAVGGNVRAFEALLTRHQGKVLRVLRLLGVRQDDVEDTAQEVFLRAFRGLHGFKKGRPFGAWIYRITVNAAMDHRGRERARLQDHDEVSSERLSELPGVVPELDMEAARLRGRLLAALAALTDRERAVFVLKEIEGLDNGEIAVALRVSRITVRRHLGLARDRLRGILSAG